MPEYTVTVDNEESSAGANSLSLTGRVNGVNCAVVIRLSEVEGLKAKEAKLIKQRALVGAYLSRTANPPAGMPGDRISL